VSRSRAGVLERLERRADDVEAWLELAADLRRRGRVPPELAARGHVDGLTRALALSPHERALAELWARALGVELPWCAAREPGSWWAARGRLGEEGEHWYDRVTGAPLYLRLPELDLWLARVPAPEPGPGEGFWLGVLPVTAGQYRQATGVSPHAYGEAAPASFLSFAQAQLFPAMAAGALGGGEGPPPGWRLRLPSEAEWRQAAGEPPTQLEEVGWFAETSATRLPACGRLRADGLGLHDSFGLVWEWTLDLWGGAEPPPGGEPALLGGHPGERVILGGDTTTSTSRVRGVPRWRGSPGARGGHGLRVGLFPPPGLTHPPPRTRDELDAWLEEFPGRGAGELLTRAEAGRFRRAAEALRADPDPWRVGRLLRAFGAAGRAGDAPPQEERGAWSTGEELYPLARPALEGLDEHARETLLGELLAEAAPLSAARLLELAPPTSALRGSYRRLAEAPEPRLRVAALRGLRAVAREEDRGWARSRLRAEGDVRARLELKELAKPGNF